MLSAGCQELIIKRSGSEVSWAALVLEQAILMLHSYLAQWPTVVCLAVELPSGTLPRYL